MAGFVINMEINFWQKADYQGWENMGGRAKNGEETLTKNAVEASCQQGSQSSSILLPWTQICTRKYLKYISVTIGKIWIGLSLEQDYKRVWMLISEFFITMQWLCKILPSFHEIHIEGLRHKEAL